MPKFTILATANKWGGVSNVLQNYRTNHSTAIGVLCLTAFEGKIKPKKVILSGLKIVKMTVSRT